MPDLNHDVLLHIASFLESEEDYASLFRCSLVNRAMNAAMNQALYRKVTLSPPFTSAFRLGRQDQELNQSWKSALMPHNASHVLEVHVLGFLSEKTAAQNNFPDVLCDSIRKWVNLRSVSLLPRQYPPDLFTGALSTLKNSPHLRHLAVNRACFDEIRAPLLVQLESLTSLTLESPTRHVLQRLPDWLSRLAPGLRDLSMTDNCGSVTPGVLTACAPYLSELHSFALGLSYSVTDDDAFQLFDQLKSLASIDFRYYLQLRVPSVRPNLPFLRSLTVRHMDLNNRRDAIHLTKWIRYLSTRSPLQEFRLAVDHRIFLRPPTINLDGLADHLGLRHGATLTVLDISEGYVGKPALTNLCARCQNLQRLSIGTAVNVLTCLSEILSPCKDLHTVAIFTPNIKAHKVRLEISAVKEIIEKHPRLRRFTLNKTSWEASWTANEEREVVLTIREVPKKTVDTDSA